MRKALRILVGMILSISPVLSQTTTVTGTVKDTANQGWINAKLTFNLYNPSHVQRPIYCKTNLPVTVIQTAFAGTDANASYSISLPQNSTICPANTRWQLTVCPIATSGCFTDAPINATGASLTYNVTPDPPSFSGPNTYGYRTDEVLNPQIGDLFWSVYSNLCSQYNGGTLISPAWQVCRVNTNSNAFIKPGGSDNIQYVSNNGNDTNDGLSWGSAKLTVAAACAALPGGNNTCTGGSGTVYVSPSFTGTILVPTVVNNQTFPPSVTVNYLPSTGRNITLGSGSFPASGAGLQSAVTSLCAAGQVGGGASGGTILIPDVSIYMLSTTDISNCSIRIIGSGALSTILDGSFSGPTFLIDHQIGGIELRNFTIIATDTNPAIEFQSPSSPGVIVGVKIENIGFSAANPLETTGAQIALEFNASIAGEYACTNCIFDNLKFDGNIVAFKTIGTGNVPNGEGNLWSNIDIHLYDETHLMTVSPIQSDDNSEIWSNVRVDNYLAPGVAGFSTTGVFNTINIVCDSSSPCVADTGIANKLNVNFISGTWGTKANSSTAWVSDSSKNASYFIPASLTITGGLPTCNTAVYGTQLNVTDGTTTLIGSVPTVGSGSIHNTLWCDGSNWRVMASNIQSIQSMEWPNQTLCTPSANTVGSTCTGTFTFPNSFTFPDGNFGASIQPISSVNTSLVVTLGAKTQTTINYGVTCVANCSAYGTLTYDVMANHP